MQRHRFGRRAETLPIDQLELGLEDIQQTEAADVASAEAAELKRRAEAAVHRRANRGQLPDHLPRIEAILDIENKVCPCCTGALHVIGEDRAERLDVIPARFQVLVVRRPRYGCRPCEGVVLHAPALARLIEGGMPTEATVAHVVVAKYADHLPLYRQAQVYARQGVRLDRSTLADWTGRAAFLLRPIHARLLQTLKASPKLFTDETTAPVLDRGRGHTKTGQLWAYARDDRPWGGTDPPAVAYVYAPDRLAERPMANLALNRKNALFAGSDSGAERWAVLATLIETAKLNAIDPQAYLTDVITRIVQGHPQSQIDAHALELRRRHSHRGLRTALTIKQIADPINPCSSLPHYAQPDLSFNN